MWFYIGYGTLLGAVLGLGMPVIAKYAIDFKLEYLVHVSSSGLDRTTKKGVSNIQLAFWYDALMRDFHRNPIGMSLGIFGLPTFIGATLGFTTENILRLF